MRCSQGIPSRWDAVLPGGFYFIEDLQLGRHRSWDDSQGAAVISDVLQSWIDQKLIRYSDGPHRNWFEAKWDTGYHKNFAQVDANGRALEMRKRFPLPPNVAFIFCQEEACVIGKEGRNAKRRGERGCKRMGKRAE
mmetsp:Transcript_15450/g.34565  ORF Transcript_15450/g.34565 Transcript_15450/m.34565 type:complete len:136 (-) Transcript_15450:773-1180(-)